MECGKHAPSVPGREGGKEKSITNATDRSCDPHLPPSPAGESCTCLDADRWAQVSSGCPGTNASILQNLAAMPKMSVVTKIDQAYDRSHNVGGGQ